ncbi:MAG: hypothetical protein UV78_C0003G0014 [Parcubacteria group bacterium GW2011_GWA2_43_17]|nr:MAG: hypothetical protein UV78_C0003G0014 [Parcubacteria group bacterium GW2011_GWA2_43_17]OHB44373.1 MAG: hypothetical protein A2Y13_08175 [Planctomycetes bacterium GWC2_45_44]
MCRKVVYLSCVAAMLSMAMQVSAANNWVNATGDGKWSTAANWDVGVVPTMTPDSNGNPHINLTDANACTLDGTQPHAVCQWLNLGSSAGQTGTLNVVSGGTIGGDIGTPAFGPGETWIGLNGSNGILNIDGIGSFAKSEGWRIGAGAVDGGSAVVNITNGGKMAGGTWNNYIHATGTVNIIDGTMEVVMLGSSLTIDAGGRIVLYPNGKLDLYYGDQTNLVNGLIAQGRITSNSSRCSLEVFYDEDTNWTHVTSTCKCTTIKTGDLNRDCYVNFLDFADFASQWLSCTDSLNPACSQ